MVKNKYNGVGGHYDDDELKINNTNQLQKDENKGTYQYKPTLKKPLYEEKKVE